MAHKQGCEPTSYHRRIPCLEAYLSTEKVEWGWENWVLKSLAQISFWASDPLGAIHQMEGQIPQHGLLVLKCPQVWSFRLSQKVWRSNLKQKKDLKRNHIKNNHNTYRHIFHVPQCSHQWWPKPKYTSWPLTWWHSHRYSESDFRDVKNSVIRCIMLMGKFSKNHMHRKIKIWKPNFKTGCCIPNLNDWINRNSSGLRII